MARSFTYEALVLRARPAGESNREAWFLTREEGILKATVFGGPKSRLRAYVSPFHQGTLWVYHNPVRDYRTVTDFDVRCWRPGLREQYERIETAGTVAETALASFGGGGNWERALDLAGSALDALSEADAACCSRILIHFLWNWLDFLGLKPDIRHCASCACEYPAHGVVLFGGPDGTLRCPSCAGSEAGLIPVGPGARRWLAAVSPLSPSALKRYTLDRASRSQALALATGLTAYALGQPPAVSKAGRARLDAGRA